METRKIAVACCIGGLLCCAVALMFAPIYWWFGLIAGFAGGYISYEFREVLKAVPVAARMAFNKSSEIYKAMYNSVRNKFSNTRAWLNDGPHPFLFPACLIALPFVLISAHGLSSDMCLDRKNTDTTLGLLSTISVSALMIFIVCGSLIIVLSLALLLVALLGARLRDKSYWLTFEGTYSAEELAKKGYREVPLNYKHAFKCVGLGVGIIVSFLFWKMWPYIIIGIAVAICAVLWTFGRFLWYLVKLIHSKERVLCGVDGMLGGAVSYIWLAPTATSFAGHLVLVAFGGLLGAAFGVLNWEIVSKRILKVVPVTA